MVEFTLTDAQAPFDSGNLAAGVYRVVEGDTAGRLVAGEGDVR